MTDKDPKDMTVSELLRKAGNGYEGANGTVMMNLIDLMGLSRKIRHSECLYALADKIDAELAQARDLSLRQGAELWAKANGWPDFEEGEDFGQWLDRCTVARPRFADGEPVQWCEDRVLWEGDTQGFYFNALSESGVPLAKGGGKIRARAEMTEDGFVKRPAPEVLGADGLPIKVGDAMWSLSGAGPLTVTSLHTDDPTPDGGDSPWADLDDDGLYSWIYAGSLTHTPPDTLERLRDDMCRTAEEWREADSVSIPDMNHWADRLAALIERKGGAE